MNLKKRKNIQPLLIITALTLSFLLTACGGGLSVSDGSETPTEKGSESAPATLTEGSTSGTTTEAVEITTEAVTETTPEQTEETTETEPIFNDEIGDGTNPIIASAEALIGIPFTTGGSTPDEGFDNSGFIYYVLRENGYINCPRQGAEQAAMGDPIPLSDVKAGDLVFFSTDGSGIAEFGGIYIGGGKMIYSPSPGLSVKETLITGNYWVENFATAISLS